MEIVEYGQAVTIEIDHLTAQQIIDSSELWRRQLKLKEQPFRLTKVGGEKYTLETRGVAGFIRVKNITLEIAPKFLNRNTAGHNWRTAMWRFLAYGRGIEALSQTSGHHGVEEGISDVLADMFLTSLRGASTRGYALGYRQKNLNSSFLSGRLDSKKYSKILPVTGRIGIVATRLTNDIPTNRLLKWAGNELARTVESPERRKRLQLWADELPNVSAIAPFVEQVPSPTHQYPHLVHAIEIAKLLLEDREVGYSEGVQKLPGFLWDSDDLFERATRRLLTEACRPLGYNVSKRNHALAKTTVSGIEKITHTTPDIDVWNGEKSVFIADSKYKNISNNPSNEDFYQILAAGRVRSVPVVALLYPSTGAGINEREYKPIGYGSPAIVLVTTIGLESFSTRNQIRMLRDEVTSWMARAISTPEP